VDERDVYRALIEAQEKGLPAALATVIRTQGSMPRHAGSKMLVWPDGRIVGTIGGGEMESRIIHQAQSVITEGQSRVVSVELHDLASGDPGICGGTADIFIEPIVTPATLLIIGCGHIGKALAELAKWLHYRVIVSDDRPDYCNPQHIPGMDEYVVAKPSEIPQRVGLGPHTFVAAVTRGQPIDLDLIPALVQANVAYVGLVGSRRRWALTSKALEEHGIPADALARIHAPIGLELNAETPQEIAVSILAEIIMLQRGGTGKPMQWVPKSETADEADALA